ncbi:MAG TPA: hypothetical protein VFH23_01280 [Jiangellaceae bacterium]|nr:hypothetical protein [Jiangellaceae bacterium]
MRKVDVAVAAVVVAATAAATVILPALDDDKPEVLQAPSGEVVEIHPDGLDRGPVERRGPVTMDPEEPLVCIVDIDCLLHEVEGAAARPLPVHTETAPPLPTTG